MIKVLSINNLAINDADNLYQQGDYKSWLEDPYTQPGYQPAAIELEGSPPLITHIRRAVKSLNLNTQIKALDIDEVRTLRNQLLAAVNPTAGAVALVIADDDGEGGWVEGTERYLYVVARQPGQNQDQLGSHFVFTLDVTGDPHWRSFAPTEVEWTVTNSDQVAGVNNSGPLEAYPTITLNPALQKLDSYLSWRYRWPVHVRWRSPNRARQYPVCITFDTATLVSEEKVASKNNLAVIVNGREVRHWFSPVADGEPGGWNHAETKIWFNADFNARAYALTQGAISEFDQVSSLQIQPYQSPAYTGGIDTSIDNFPDSGYLLVESAAAPGYEIFHYTSKDSAHRTFRGVTRAVSGTSAVSHATGAAIWSLDHEIYLVYGDKTAQRALTDAHLDSFRPAFSMTQSTNEQWVYLQFGDDDGNRTARWEQRVELPGISFNTGDLGSNTNPWQTIGISGDGAGIGQWLLHQPAGITSYEAFGRQREEPTTFESVPGRLVLVVYGRNAANLNANEDTPGLVDKKGQWENWTASETVIGSESNRIYYIGLRNERHAEKRVEIANITLNLDEEQSPLVMVPTGGETENYDMDATIVNETTGDELRITIPTLNLTEAVMIDTENWTAVSFGDNANRFASLEWNGRQLMTLAPGANVIRYREPGVQAVLVEFLFHRRYFT